MSEVKLKLAPPWVVYGEKVKALFDGDPQIVCNVEYSSGSPSITIATNNGNKATALVKLLPAEQKFGNIVFKINVDCNHMSNRAFVTAKELIDTAFEGNPAFAYCVAVDGTWFVPFTYCVFKATIVQMFVDNLHDPHGIITTLYQDIAAEVFEDTVKALGGNVAFCTDIEHKILGMPTNWP